ncbi:ran-specific GTPase-activating protein-like isoform X1 [Amphiura filiformis]|uniref:ran-specific GTPase-activating protein-like isoform X1 n=1 Tax=Amphiura filiformis TaxID=82378 RepID=UPI003B216D84
MADEKHEEPGPNSPDVHFEPLVKLAPIDIKTLEEDEEELFKMRAKLFRYDSSLDPPEWKERGTGDVKLLKHKTGDSRIRLLMRRDKAYKVCANHYVQTNMSLKPSSGSDRAWVWNTPADFADEEARPETLAIRFANAENAQKFKDKFEECQKAVTEMRTISSLSLQTREFCKQLSNQDGILQLAEDSQDTEKTPNENGDKSADEVAKKLGEMSVKESQDQAEEKKSETSGETNGDKPEEKTEEKTDVKEESVTTPKKDEESKDGGTEKTESKD